MSAPKIVLLSYDSAHANGSLLSLFVDDVEFGSFLSRISTKNQTGNVAEIPSILQTLWGWPPQLEWEGSIKQGKTVVKVLGPAFSIFGSSTERAFFTALKRKEVASGFVSALQRWSWRDGTCPSKV